MQMVETLIAGAIIISFPHTLFLFADWPNEFSADAGGTGIR